MKLNIIYDYSKDFVAWRYIISHDTKYTTTSKSFGCIAAKAKYQSLTSFTTIRDWGEFDKWKYVLLDQFNIEEIYIEWNVIW